MTNTVYFHTTIRDDVSVVSTATDDEETPPTSKRYTHQQGEGGILEYSNSKKFSFNQLKTATTSFHNDEDEIRVFRNLKLALVATKRLLESVNQVSKLYQALQWEDITKEFHEVTEQIEKALGNISFEKLDISEEIKEQIELAHVQFKRAKERIDTPDLQLYIDLQTAETEKDPDPSLLIRLSEKLQLRTINDLKKESLALHEMVITCGGDPGNCFEDISALLKKLKNSVLTENPDADSSERVTNFVRHRSPVIPDNFRCPISLKLLKDPVIVSTGQTYERSCIQKWLDAGHRTCPKTQQTLVHTVLTPNYVLESLISQWCESNGVELPKKQEGCKNWKSGPSVSDCDRTAIDPLLQKLSNGNPEEQRAATGSLRLLAKQSGNNRICIAEAGAIPLLVDLLSTPDPRTQEQAVTALLNLSINETNKGIIVTANAIPGIVCVLKNGSIEARENAAATLWSLSVTDENNVAIGAAGAIPALINLLCHGSPRGKKDAANAIFNLSIYPGNKVRAVRAGIVVPLMRLLMDTAGGMMDEALAILSNLARHQEGRTAIGEAEPIPILVEVMRTGSPRNHENAASVLWSLCTVDVKHLESARVNGVEEALKELSEKGTWRAKRKAVNLLAILHQS